MPFPYAGVAGVLGGLGSLAGGVSGLFGGGNNNAALEASRINAEQDRAFQMAAATQGIRWKVNDAKAAGIHPLYALGAPTFSPSPTSLMSDGGGSGRDIGGSLSQMGQGVERALMAAAPQDERDATIAATLQAQQVERGSLENEYLRAQIRSLGARTQADQIGPPGASLKPAGMIDGQTGSYERKPPEVLNSQPSNAAYAAGTSQPSVRWERNPDGSVIAMPTGQMDDLSSPGYMNYMYQNRVAPAVSGDAKPPRHMLPDGASDWRFVFPGVWKPVFNQIPDGRSYVHEVPPGRRGRALPRVINNP